MVAHILELKLPRAQSIIPQKHYRFRANVLAILTQTGFLQKRKKVVSSKELQRHMGFRNSDMFVASHMERPCSQLGLHCCKKRTGVTLEMIRKIPTIRGECKGIN